MPRPRKISSLWVPDRSDAFSYNDHPAFGCNTIFPSDCTLVDAEHESNDADPSSSTHMLNSWSVLFASRNLVTTSGTLQSLRLNQNTASAHIDRYSCDSQLMCLLRHSCIFGIKILISLVYYASRHITTVEFSRTQNSSEVTSTYGSINHKSTFLEYSGLVAIAKASAFWQYFETLQKLNEHGIIWSIMCIAQPLSI
ncbi:uncharacterized protein RAG0_00413 [Rhynchosporium agropyri]|uniref:Uncharacterized protein n=1 Tax=Rhynchosporium agropyri TaxID=914238 RepID=A0A1E1JX15_9HELO|nr:uncharacterized protein RAG0_00413 [Rhynchosporium agropyri]